MCQTSKSLIYHYYASKEDILFDVMHSHVKALLDAAEEIAAKPLRRTEKLRELTRAFMRLYLGAAFAAEGAAQRAATICPTNQRKIIVDIQHRLIAIVEDNSQRNQTRSCRRH